MTPWAFPLKRPGWVSPHGGDGLVAVQDATADPSWADVALGVYGSLIVLWSSVGARPEKIGVETLFRPRVRAVTLMPAGDDTRYTAVGLRFAAHLAAERSQGGLPFRPCLTSWSRPTRVQGWLRLPHLLSVEDANGIQDLAIWELIRVRDAAEWIDGPLPDLAFIEAHLSTVYGLRTAARTGHLPATYAAQRLRGLLGTRPLSIRLVFQHLDLIRLLVMHEAFRGGARAR
jgi:hypothetical protein